MSELGTGRSDPIRVQVGEALLRVAGPLPGESNLRR